MAEIIFHRNQLGQRYWDQIVFAATLARANILKFDHGNTTITTYDKLALLELQKLELKAALIRANILPTEADLKFAVSRTLTGLTSNGLKFIVTFFGLTPLSIAEKKTILSILGEEPSTKNAKAMKLGPSSDVDLYQMGLGEGYVGPFHTPMLDIKRIYLIREPGIINELDGIVANLALGLTLSLFVRLTDFSFVLDRFAILEGTLKGSYGYSPIASIRSPDQVIFPL